MSLLTRLFAVLVIAGLILASAGSSTAAASQVFDYPFATPVFGLDTAPDGSLLVADSGAGIVELRKGEGSLVAELPGVSDVASIGHGSMFAITGGMGGDTAGRLYRVSQGSVREIADLGAFEAEYNPHPAQVDSNPFDVAVLNGGQALVADAAGNSLLIVDQNGSVDWVATFPNQMVSTDYIKQLIGCPDAPEELAFVCGFPELFPAEAVPTSVVVGPDGAYYVGELTGFPAEPGVSRIWRIEPGTLHAECGTSQACTVVASGFTSIIDINVGPDGTVYVVEFDEGTFLAAQLFFFFGIPGMAGGTVNACAFGSWTCTVLASDLTIPTAVAADKDGVVYAVVEGLFPSAHVTTLP